MNDFISKDEDPGDFAIGEKGPRDSDVREVTTRSVDDQIFQSHPQQHLSRVMEDILPAYPYESFYFLNIGKLRQQIGILRDYFLPHYPQRAIAYAVKANPKRHILRVLASEGINHFDCSTPFEIDTVLRVNPSAKVLYNHPTKAPPDITYAANLGVHHFTAQTQREVGKILVNAREFVTKPLEITVRMRTPSAAKIDFYPKFGATPNEVQVMIQQVRTLFNCVPGISVHTGSQNPSTRSFVEAIKKMSEVAEASGGVNIMNVGGGIPVNYQEQDRFELQEYLQIISEALNKYALNGSLDNLKIIIELGRAIIAEPIDLVVPVLGVEDRDGQRCVYFNDGIFTSFSDAVIHGWQYQFKCLDKNAQPLSSNRVPFKLFGRTCDSGDTLGIVHLSENIQEGDYVWIPNAGAYMDAQATHFTGFGTPKYVIYNL